MDNVVGCLHVHTESNRNSGEDYHREARLPLKTVDQSLPALCTLAAGAGIAIDYRGFEAEALLNRMLQFTLDVPQLGEKDDLIAAVRTRNVIQRA